jgi:hypothetical protein
MPSIHGARGVWTPKRGGVRVESPGVVQNTEGA